MITIKNLQKSYEGKPVLKGLSLTIKEGDIVGITGASGIGKTTLFRILMGLETMDGGKIEGIEGKKISAVFQEDRLCESISAIKNITLVWERPLLFSRRKASELKKKESEIGKQLKEILPEDSFSLPVCFFSGGMKRRVAIARAMFCDSDLILMDEPLKGLDQETKQKVIQFILKYRQNRTLLIITHHAEEMKTFGSCRVFDI